MSLRNGHSPQTPETRRDALRLLSRLAGGALSAAVIAYALRGSSSHGHASSRALTPSQDALLSALSETIVPATDTPGAAAAQVGGFIDFLLSQWFTKPESKRFLAGLAALDDRCRRERGQGFTDLSPASRLAFLTIVDRQAFNASAPDRQTRFFKRLKELTLIGYYTSEIGMAQELGVVGPVGDHDPQGLPYGASWL